MSRYAKTSARNGLISVSSNTLQLPWCAMSGMSYVQRKILQRAPMTKRLTSKNNLPVANSWQLSMGRLEADLSVVGEGGRNQEPPHVKWGASEDCNQNAKAEYARRTPQKIKLCQTQHGQHGDGGQYLGMRLTMGACVVRRNYGMRIWWEADGNGPHPSATW